MVSCDTKNLGCQGGMLNKAWDYIKEFGLATEECYPYKSGGGATYHCEATCQDGSQF